MAKVKSSELLANLELEDLKFILRERRLRWFGHWSVQVAQSEQQVIYRLMAGGGGGGGGGREAQINMEKTDGERLP